MKGKLLYGLISCLILAGSSCSTEEIAPSLVLPSNCTVDSNAVMSYQNDIQPIISSACLSCHYAGSGLYDYSRYEVLADRIRAGRLEERLLLPLENPLHMPQGFNMD